MRHAWGRTERHSRLTVRGLEISALPGFPADVHHLDYMMKYLNLQVRDRFVFVLSIATSQNMLPASIEDMNSVKPSGHQ